MTKLRGPTIHCLFLFFALHELANRKFTVYTPYSMHTVRVNLV